MRLTSAAACGLGASPTKTYSSEDILSRHGSSTVLMRSTEIANLVSSITWEDTLQLFERVGNIQSNGPGRMRPVRHEPCPACGCLVYPLRLRWLDRVSQVGLTCGVFCGFLSDAGTWVAP